MKNREVVKMFFNNKRGHTLNVYATENELINYNTTMVKRVRYGEDIIYYVNISYYSSTTCKIQSYINCELNYITDKIIYYYGNKYGDNYLDINAQLKPIGYFNVTNNSSSLVYSYDDDEIIFRNSYFNSIGNEIKRKIKVDKNGDFYFLYGGRVYLKDVMKCY